MRGELTTDSWYQQAERLLKTLANVNRLRLLEILQSPRAYAELSLPPSRPLPAEAGPRFISRQALHQHLRALHRLGLVEKLTSNDRPEPQYVVNRARLWAELEGLRRLARVRPEVEVGHGARDVRPPYLVDAHHAPHLVLVRGADEGRVFPLEGRPGEWVVGRARAAPVCLDYDAGVSPAHARVATSGGPLHVEDLGSANGTWINWRRIPPHAPTRLSHGDVLGFGASFLLYREA